MRSASVGNLARAALLVLASTGAVMANGTTPATETITGVFLGPGVECPQFRLEDGEQISLTGPVPEAEIGSRLVLSGHWAAISFCMQGRTFRVVAPETETNR